MKQFHPDLKRFPDKLQPEYYYWKSSKCALNCSEVGEILLYKTILRNN